MTTRATDQPVLVTGATGFIGSETVRQLLGAGYRVRGTTRDTTRAVLEDHLLDLARTANGLEMFEANLLDNGAFDEAVAGCEFVHHIASPYAVNVEDPQRDLLDPAVEGTLNVLRSCLKAGTVKRVVLTSSFAAIMKLDTDRIFDEDDWNEDANLDFAPYSYSKTMAEKAAWEFVENEDVGFDLVVINPVGVIGPSIVPRVNETDSLFIGMTNGTQPAIVAIDYPYVDVRDVALGHVLAMENTAASGRYLTAAGNLTARRIREIGKDMFDGKHRFPPLSLDRGIGVPLSRALLFTQPKGTRDFLKATVGRPHIVDNSKIREELGIEFRDLDQSVRDTWFDLEQWGFLGRKVSVGDTTDDA